MKACQHFQKPYGFTEIVPSDGFIWNAWVEVWQADRLVWSAFQTGLMWDYLQHLATSEACRKEVGLSHEEVERRLKEIENEWQKRMEPKIMAEAQIKAQIKVLTDDEAWKLGLPRKALALCEENDLLVGFIQDNRKYYAIIYTVKPRRRYLRHIKL
jgi:hypothetical protein